MLTSNVSRLGTSVSLPRLCGRGYSTQASTGKAGEFTFSTEPVQYSQLIKLKKARFGTALDEFKQAHEAPIVQLHMEIRLQKLREAKKSQNRQATKAANLRRKDKRTRKAEVAAMHTREFKLQEQLKELLNEDDVTVGQFVTGGHPQVQELLKQKDIFEDVSMPFDAFDAEAEGSDAWWSVGNLNASFEPDRLKLAPGDRWHWERTLPDEELRKIIAADILSCDLPLREDAQVIATGMDSVNEEDFESQGQRLSPLPATDNGILKPLTPEWLPVNVSSPSVLSKDQIPVKRFKKHSNQINFSSSETPFMLETDEFPILTEMAKRGSPLPAAQIQRKAKLRIHLPTLGLPHVVQERLIALSGTRYDAEMDMVTLTADTQPTRDENVGTVYRAAGNLLHEAWKADLNYVEVGDNLPPHEQIERQIELDNEAAALQESLNPDSFKRPRQFTFFRVASYPQPAAIQKGREAVKAILQEIAI